MGKQRIDYIDWLKGLSIICVVWFHLPHPEWLNFSFRMPLFFLLSGIFFKVVPTQEYLRKKTRQLLIPFLGFYLIYCGFFVLEYRYSPTHPEHIVPYQEFVDLFCTHNGYDCLHINAPLWFILALINLQLITMLLVRLLRKPLLILTAAVVITVIGAKYIFPHETYFMFGRALPYLAYYMIGHLYGKRFLQVIESGERPRFFAAAAGITVMLASSFIAFKPEHPARELMIYIFNLALIVTLILLFRYVSRVPRLRFFHFFGRNSYVVLGTHYMLVMTLFILLSLVNLKADPLVGLIALPFILTLEVMLIKIINRYLPELAGKQRPPRLKPAPIPAVIAGE